MRAKTRGVGDVNGLDWRSYAEASGSSIPRPDGSGDGEMGRWSVVKDTIGEAAQTLAEVQFPAPMKPRRGGGGGHGVTASHDSIGEQAQKLTEVRNPAPT